MYIYTCTYVAINEDNFVIFPAILFHPICVHGCPAQCQQNAIKIVAIEDRAGCLCLPAHPSNQL